MKIIDLDLTGERRGKVRIVDRISKDKWFCICDCGVHLLVSVYRLVDGGNRRIITGCKNCSQRKHSLRGTRGYKTWGSMKERCYSPTNASFYRYGGRGIKVCDRWLHSAENFIVDMGQPPRGMSLDRIDNDGDYEPSNCRWATQVQQERNKGNNNKITYKGETRTIAEWGEITGIPNATLYCRKAKGWSVDEILNGRTTKVKREKGPDGRFLPKKETQP